MKELIESLEEAIAKLRAEAYSPWRDVAIGGLETAVNNIAQHSAVAPSANQSRLTSAATKVK